jgi:serine/threonine protein phosphatase PrpC
MTTLTSEPLRCPVCGTVAVEGSRFCEEDGTELAASAAILGPSSPSYDLAIASDIGYRHTRNEDAGTVVRELIGEQPRFVLVVCDGVSSSANSDVAAAAAASAARSTLAAELAKLAPDGSWTPALTAAVRSAHAAACSVVYTPEPDKAAPGTTIVAAVATRDRIAVGWLGDSRAYWVGRHGEGLLTHDDSWLNDVLDRGALSIDAALQSPEAHVITHCIGPLETDGAEITIEPHTVSFAAPPGACLVLCTDGFWNYAPEPEQVAALVRSRLSTAEDARTIAHGLVEYALGRGGQDNVTVAVAFLS